MPPRRTGAANRGFTLIEISVVVLIIAIILSAAVVKLARILPSSAADAAARSLISSLDLARTYAVSHGRRYEVWVDIDERGWAVMTPFDAEGKIAHKLEDRTTLGWQYLEKGLEFDSILDGKGQVFEKGKIKIAFDSSGATGDLFIHFTHTAGEQYDLTVRVLGLNGLSSVFSGSIDPTMVSESDF